MSRLPAKKATNSVEAYRICTPEPLVGEDLERYYVDLSEIRSAKTVKSIVGKWRVLEPGEFCTLLFTGHRGCGKSTELRKIQNRLDSEYRVIYLEADTELDLNDADYTDLYLLVIKKIADELYKLGAKFDQKLLENFETWFKDITQETEQSVEKSISLQATAEAGLQVPFLSKLTTKLLAQIKGSQKERKIIRQTLQRDISRLQANINLLLEDAFYKLYGKVPQYSKGFLLIIDNLDRIPPHVGNHLFFDYAAQIQGLQTTIIYTAPISTVYFGNNLSSTFGNPNIMPMVNMYEYKADEWDLDFFPDKLETFTKLIDRRVDLDAVFASRDLVLELTKASGGHVRQLMQMTSEACLLAASDDRDQVTAEDVTYAIKAEQFKFERITLNEYYPVLAKVCLGKNIDKDETGQKLLFNLSVLEYNGDRRWNYINPAIKQSELFQTALTHEQQSGTS